jgi:hypothetical protein
LSIGWNFYFGLHEGKSASIALDFDLRERAPDPVRPNLVRIKLGMLNPRPDGLSSSEESETLFAIEDAVCPPLQQACNGQIVARITCNGNREWLFYAASGDFVDEIVTNALKNFARYACAITKVEDPTWRVFLDEIYPSEEEEQWVLNRIVLDRMQAKGDALDSPRDTRHFIFFCTSEQRLEFRKAAQSLGYSVESEQESDNNRHPFSICVSKTQDMGWATLHDDFIKLFRTCRASGGFYDGWECEMVVKQ